MPDLNHSIEKHTIQMRRWWRDPEYIKERKAFVIRHPACVITPGRSGKEYRIKESDLEDYLKRG
jgi:hypothetical protein